MFGFALTAFVWAEARKWAGTWTTVAVIGCVLVLIGAREIGCTPDKKDGLEKIGA